MSTTEFQIFQRLQRSNWVRLRTLVILRWIAIVGQVGALLVASRAYELQIEVAAAALIIFSSVLANLFSIFLYPENKRLSEREATLMLVFDIVQLSLLIYLTGGLNNPFALLILAPVTIAATVLGLGNMFLVGTVAIGLVTAIGLFHIPIRTGTGDIFVMPALFQFGFWVSLVIGILFMAYYARQVTNEMHAMGDALVATQLALSREQKLTDLGGVVAAAAHELGTPLATIKLVSGELIEELDDRPELLEDAHLIRQQADRCREILHSMGRAGKDDLHLRSAPVEAVIEEAAEPHRKRGKLVDIYVSPEVDDESQQPSIVRRPEIIHGLRNLIQNAVDFAERRVEITVGWTATHVVVTIADDGPGFPLSVIGRIGDPYVRRRRGAIDQGHRPGYEGMGLGLFIAKTLLERSGAELDFSNGRRHGQSGWAGQPTGGAIVTVEWPRSKFEDETNRQSSALGENKPFLP